MNVHAPSGVAKVIDARDTTQRQSSLAPDNCMAMRGDTQPAPPDWHETTLLLLPVGCSGGRTAHIGQGPGLSGCLLSSELLSGCWPAPPNYLLTTTTFDAFNVLDTPAIC